MVVWWGVVGWGGVGWGVRGVASHLVHNDLSMRGHWKARVF